MDIQRRMDFILEQHGRTAALLQDLAVRQEKAEKRTAQADKRMEALTAAQERTEKSLKALIESLRKSSNGR